MNSTSGLSAATIRATAHQLLAPSTFVFVEQIASCTFQVMTRRSAGSTLPHCAVGGFHCANAGAAKSTIVEIRRACMGPGKRRGGRTEERERSSKPRRNTAHVK